MILYILFCRGRLLTELSLLFYFMRRVNAQTEADMASMQAVINLGRFARDKRSISLKTPVKALTVVCKDVSTLNALEKLQLYVKGELNAWEVRGSGVFSPREANHTA